MASLAFDAVGTTAALVDVPGVLAIAFQTLAVLPAPASLIILASGRFSSANLAIHFLDWYSHDPTAWSGKYGLLRLHPRSERASGAKRNAARTRRIGGEAEARASLFPARCGLRRF